MRFPFESKLPNYVISWYQIQDKPRSGQRRFHGAHTARITTACGIRKQKRPAGEFPCRPYGGEAPPGQSNQFATRDAKKSRCGGPSAALRRARRIAAAMTAKRKGASSGDAGCGGRRPETRKARRGTSPRGPLPARAARLRTSPRARNRASIEKHPPRARRPALPQPFAAVLSAKAGLTAGFGMGPGDPRLCGRARGGRSPAAHDMEPAWVPCPGRPWRPHGGHGRRWRIALGASIEDAKSSGY